MLIHIHTYLVSSKYKTIKSILMQAYYQRMDRVYIFDSIWYVNVRIPGELFYYVTAHVPCAKRSHNNVESKL